MIANVTTSIEDLALLVEQEIHVRASIEDTFAALLEQLGPANRSWRGQVNAHGIGSVARRTLVSRPRRRQWPSLGACARPSSAPLPS